MKTTYRKEIESVFKENYREFCLLSYNYVACMDLAQDIVQDVFVKILMKDKVSNIVNLKAYIWRSVKNNSLKHVVRSKKMESIEQSKLVLVEKDETRNKELDFKLQKAMDQLPPKCRNVFELCVIDDHKYNSAADSLGITVNTVKTHIKKAYKILRYALANTHVILFFILTINFIRFF